MRLRQLLCGHTRCVESKVYVCLGGFRGYTIDSMVYEVLRMRVCIYGNNEESC